jgi:hypothetical protein
MSCLSAEGGGEVVVLPIFPVYSNDLSNVRGYKTLHSKLVSYTQCTRADFQMRG